MRGLRRGLSQEEHQTPAPLPRLHEAASEAGGTMTDREGLLRRRLELLEAIAQAANEVKRIDRSIAILDSCDLERDLLQAEKNFSN
jgi:hypothetical protein